MPASSPFPSREFPTRTREFYGGNVLIQAVAQWQGAATRAGALIDGCRALAALAGETLGRPVTTVPIGSDGSSTVDGVANRDALVRNRAAQLAALEAPEQPVLTIGGDCASDLVPVGVARYRYGADLAAVWFDAHADCNTPETSPSGAFHGMVLRSLLGQGDDDFAASPALAPGRAVLAGARDFDPAERAAVDDGLLRHVPVPVPPADLLGQLRDAGARRVYVHVDLDVLDPEEFDRTTYRVPGGLTVSQLVAGIEALAAFDVVGAAITECAAERREHVLPLVPVLDAICALLDGQLARPE